MRLDHLLSKRLSRRKLKDRKFKHRRFVSLFSFQKKLNNFSGDDALRGNTRLHPEHDG